MDALALLGQRRSDGDDAVVLPMVTLHLRSGKDVTGWILGKDDKSPQGPSMLIHTVLSNPSQPQPDVTYISADFVAGITVFRADQAVSPLNGDALVPAPRQTPPPGRLVLLRQAQEMVKALGTSGPWTVEAEVTDVDAAKPEALFRTEQIIRNTHSILEEMLRDTMAREALTQKVKKIRFAVADQASVKLAADVLVITASGDPKAWLGKAGLRTGISAVL